MEFVSRFLAYTYVPYDGKLDVEEYLDQAIISLATANETRSASSTFNATFNLLGQAYGNNALRRLEGGESSGRVGLVAFECIAVGIAKNLKKIEKKDSPVEYVKERIAKFWKTSGTRNFFAAGLRGTIRIQRTIPFGTAWFSE